MPALQHAAIAVSAAGLVLAAGACRVAATATAAPRAPAPDAGMTVPGEPTPTDAAAPPALPSGHYLVSTEVTRDTCGDGAAPAPVTAFVQMKIWHGQLTGNFPLPVPAPTPAAARNYATLRSDILLFPATEPAKPVSILGVGSKCLDYATKTDYRVLATSDTEVRIRYQRDYGDAGHCPPNRKLPQHCTLDYVYTFSLQKKLCDANCGVSFRKSDAGALAQCDCH